MGLAYNQTCIWCGKPFKHTSRQRYCSDNCRLTAAYFKKELVYKGFDVTTEEACKIHRREVEKKKPISKTDKVLAPIHLTSSGVKWDYVPESEVEEGVTIIGLHDKDMPVVRKEI